jgi:uncharacterized protein YjbI with pentapeptide repeats
MTKKKNWFKQGRDDASKGGKYDPPSDAFWSSDAETRDAYIDAYSRGYRDAELVPRRFDVQGAYLRRTDLSLANLEGANLSNADFSNANFRGANFKNAKLSGTILKGADLTDARNLTSPQLRTAVLDETTKLPKEFTLEEIRQN